MRVGAALEDAELEIMSYDKMWSQRFNGFPFNALLTAYSELVTGAYNLRCNRKCLRHRCMMQKRGRSSQERRAIYLFSPFCLPSGVCVCSALLACHTVYL
jgi:hypothetical protein